MFRPCSSKNFPSTTLERQGTGYTVSRHVLLRFHPQAHLFADLEEVADLVGIPYVTQMMLKLVDPELRNETFVNAPMRHNAAGDVLLTLIALIELLRYKGLDFSLVGDWTLMSYDL